ncbi:hypothetical protein BS329_24595 [Amycolatopsis coloradensis]|uniref:Uncharacterized protein n=1 Tax=Amycolatopsis coloradensis TaxID=76021 RepID=A0A1R0KN87_9PSEU|nr:hypothetical protein BS329_24595 [Amycolatopsis coloradensis]
MSAGFDRRLLPPMMLGAALNPANSPIISVSLVPINIPPAARSSVSVPTVADCITWPCSCSSPACCSSR